MAQSGYTPIQLYRSTTAGATPSAGNLQDGELAINTRDGKIYYKNYAGAVTQFSSSSVGSAATITSSTTLTYTSAGYQKTVMTTMAQSVTLPSATTLAVGAPLYVIDNTTGGYPVGIRNSAGTLLMAVAAGGIAFVNLDDNSTAAGVWSITGDNLEPGLITIDSNIAALAGTGTYTTFPTCVDLDTNKTVYFTYSTAALPSWYAFVVDRSTGTIGTPVLLASGLSSRLQYVSKVDSSTAFIMFGSTSGSIYYMVCLTVSGTTITLGTLIRNPLNICYEDSLTVPRVAKMSDSQYAIVENTPALLPTMVTAGSPGKAATIPNNGTLCVSAVTTSTTSALNTSVNGVICRYSQGSNTGVSNGANVFGGGSINLFLNFSVNSTTGTYYTSPDGITWTSRAFPASLTLTDLQYGNGKFVAVQSGSTTGYYSTDGINWTSMTVASSQTNGWRICYSGSYWAGVSLDTTSTAAMSSTDGITWTSRTKVSGTHTVIQTNGSGLVLAMTNGTASMTTTDGITWTSRTLPASSLDTFKPAYGSGVFFVVPASSGTTVYTSPDAITWTARTLPATASSIYSINFFSGKLIIAFTDATLKYVCTSTDSGATWATALSVPSTAHTVQAYTINISGSVISYDHPAYFPSQSTSSTGSAIVPLTATTALVTAISPTNSCAVLTVSGSVTTASVFGAISSIGVGSTEALITLSSTKAISATNSQLYALTISGTTVTVGAALTGLGQVDYSYGTTRYNPPLVALSSSKALYLTSPYWGGTTAKIITESSGTLTASAGLSIARSNTGQVLPQGTSEFVVFGSNGNVTSNTSFDAYVQTFNPTGSVVVAGSCSALSGQPGAFSYLGTSSATYPSSVMTYFKTSNGDYGILGSSSGTNAGALAIPVFRSNGSFIALRGSIKIPLTTGAAQGYQLPVSNNNVPVLANGRFLNVEIAS